MSKSPCAGRLGEEAKQDGGGGRDACRPEVHVGLQVHVGRLWSMGAIGSRIPKVKCSPEAFRGIFP